MSNKIGFIGGGQMGEALIKGIITSKLYSPENIVVSEPSSERRQYLHNTYSVETLNSSEELCTLCNDIIVAVKPQVMETVLTGCLSKLTPDHLLISIAAGLPLSFYEKTLFTIDKLKVIRVMPNTPALVGQSATVFSVNVNVSNAEIKKAEKIFSEIGSTVLIDEKHMDAVTGLSGSGPAYVFTFIEALIDAGVAQGLTRAVATELTLQTVYGSVELLRQSKEHPAVERDKVTSPGGTAITGLQVLNKEGFRGIVMEAVGAATQRAKDLGKN